MIGFKIVSRKEYEKLLNQLGQVIELSAKSSSLEAENKKLLALTNAIQTELPNIDVDLGDPAPVDSAERKSYVGMVAGLHKDILAPKLKQMISTLRKELDNVGNSRELDLYLKGVSYAFGEILIWGQAMVNEQLANQIGQNPASPIDAVNK